ncbi:hypothetical protein [Segnochrobactrum spirostomi]|uniref:Uncharacterized protein n=1 Tax=Segnochrobactrum spirostomi TaxID=2608987 RepID=A0A6A7Y7F9_9HYPH|nr:hypothetical protein [Segnochrobactrum spirostomi]MQT15193.1 hypothetical protein [Segnochrobactrum spirostomi]
MLDQAAGPAILSSLVERDRADAVPVLRIDPSNRTIEAPLERGLGVSVQCLPILFIKRGTDRATDQSSGDRSDACGDHRARAAPELGAGNPPIIAPMPVPISCLSDEAVEHPERIAERKAM